MKTNSVKLTEEQITGMFKSDIMEHHFPGYSWYQFSDDEIDEHVTMMHGTYEDYCKWYGKKFGKLGEVLS